MTLTTALVASFILGLYYFTLPCSFWGAWIL